MRDFFKLFGIIALMAVIGFSMVACKNGDGGGLTPVKEPVKEFKIFELKAEKYDNIEMWTNSLSLSEFTDYTPKKGDKLKFMISGEMDESLKWFSVGLSSQINEAPWYRFLGAKENYIEELPATFLHTFEIETGDDPFAPNSVKIGFSNILWQIGDGDNSDWSHVTGLRVNDADVGKVMATIRNFKVSLLEISK